MSKEGAEGDRHITKLATHLPLALSVSYALLKTIKGSQPPLRSREDSDYENNNDFKLLKSSKESLSSFFKLLIVLNTCIQEGKKQKQTRRPQ